MRVSVLYQWNFQTHELINFINSQRKHQTLVWSTIQTEDIRVHQSYTQTSKVAIIRKIIMINSITSNMMRLGPIIQSTSSAYLKPSLQRTIQNTSSRSMTIISKQSAEDYKKQVRLLIILD